MSRNIYVFRGELDSPDYKDPPQLISRDTLIPLFEENLDGMIQYRVLGKHHFTHNNYGLEANLKFEEMPCIRFELRKTGVDTLIDYLFTLSKELGPLTVFNPEKQKLYIDSSSEMDEKRETMKDFLWPPEFKPSIEEI